MDFDRNFSLISDIFSFYGVIAFLLPFVLIYVLGYVRRRHDENPDRLLGAKVFLTLLMSVSVQIMIFGVSRMLAAGIVDEPPSRPGPGQITTSNNPAWSLGQGLLFGGIFASAYPATLYVMLRRRYPGSDLVLRSALGVNAIFTGLIFAGAVTAMMVSISMSQGRTDNWLAFTIVYLIASLGFGIPVAFWSPKQAPAWNEPITAALAPSVQAASSPAPSIE